jgi:hypothetical protein
MNVQWVAKVIGTGMVVYYLMEHPHEDLPESNTVPRPAEIVGVIQAGITADSVWHLKNEIVVDGGINIDGVTE